MHLRLAPVTPLLERGTLWPLALRTPWMFTGHSLHRAGLCALTEGAPRAAEDLFEHAALRYREDLRTEALARVRVHQRMARALAAGSSGEGEQLRLDVEHALGQLERIESPVAPFDLVDAHTLLATWLARQDDDADAGHEDRLAA